jgi:hypothetical protein
MLDNVKQLVTNVIRQQWRGMIYSKVTPVFTDFEKFGIFPNWRRNN